MARPKKTGLEYYPKDTGFFSDRKIRKLLKTFGTKGCIIYDYLLCLIYSEKGYWVQWDEDLAFDVADFLGDGISESLVGEVVLTSIKIGLFSASKFDELSILTSNGIQSRYVSAKRGKTIIDAKIKVPVSEIKVFVAETKVNVASIPQSKVKESKVEESKKKPPDHGERINSLFALFETEIKTGDHRMAIEGMYLSTRLKAGSIGKLLPEFRAQLINDNKLHKNTLELRKHLKSWLDKRNSLGQLNNYKRPEHRK